MKTDIVMWNLNGERFLRVTLPRINRVIPKNVVGQRIFMDGNSMDNSVEIALKYDWDVYTQRKKGIAAAMNEALELVETPTFVSFENDLLLCLDWWAKVAPLLKISNVAVASGIRFLHDSPSVRSFEEYLAERYKNWQSGLNPRLNPESRLQSAFLWGKTLDNTIYETEVLREVGGFPDLGVPAGIDPVLVYRLKEAGYEWTVSYEAVSEHLGRDFLGEIKQQYFYGCCYEAIALEVPGLTPDVYGLILRVFYSPLTSLHAVYKKRCPQIFFFYPLLRLNVLRGVFAGRKHEVKHPASLRVGPTP